MTLTLKYQALERECQSMSMEKSSLLHESNEREKHWKLKLEQVTKELAKDNTFNSKYH